MAGAAELADHGAVNGLVEVGILEDNEGGVSTELHAHALHGTGSSLGEDLANTRGASKAQLLDVGAGGELHGGLAVLGRHNVEAVGGDAGLEGQLGEGEGCEGGLAGGLDDDGAAGGDGGGDLASDHGGGEVPGSDDAADTDGLLECDDHGVLVGGGDDIAV